MIKTYGNFKRLYRAHKSFVVYKDVLTLDEEKNKERDKKVENHNKDREYILSMLNYYEYIAGGIREGAFDYNLYHRLYRTNIVKIWSKCETLVTELRKQEAKEEGKDESKILMFKEFEILASQFKKHEIDMPWYTRLALLR